MEGRAKKARRSMDGSFVAGPWRYTWSDSKGSVVRHPADPGPKPQRGRVPALSKLMEDSVGGGKRRRLGGEWFESDREVT